MTPPRLPYGRQWLDDDDVAAVVRVLRSDWLTQGPEIEAFEKEFAATCGAAHAVAVSNGTAALHLACLAAGLAEGDTLVTSPITFLASANCGIYCGAEVAFCDVDADMPLLSARALDEMLTRLAKSGAKPRVLIPVHYAGLCAPMESVRAVAQRHGLTVIEDACHALGATWQGSDERWHRVGSCSHSDMAVFSFHPVKHITTGEGGMITTHSAMLAGRLRTLRSHGMAKPPPSADVGGWVYTMEEPGFNYRLTDIQCALGRSQLHKLPSWVERRRAIVRQYHEAFQNLGWCSLLVEPPGQCASYHLAVLTLQLPDTSAEAGVKTTDLGDRRRRLYDFFLSRQIGVQIHYIPVYRQPYYQRRFGLQPAQFPHAERFYASCVSLPCFPRMTEDEVRRVIGVVQEAGAVLKF